MALKPLDRTTTLASLIFHSVITGKRFSPPQDEGSLNNAVIRAAWLEKRGAKETLKSEVWQRVGVNIWRVTSPRK